MTRLERAAIAYIKARRDQKRWKKKLASYKCAIEGPVFDDSDSLEVITEASEFGVKRGPCWRTQLRESEWCPECKEREWQRQSKAIPANRAVGGYASQLYRAVEAAEARDE